MQRSRIASSFRDPSGFVFRSDGIIYRQVNQRYKECYDQLMSSGLYEHLTSAGLLIPHQEAAGVQSDSPADAYKVLKPAEVPFVSYPYEWSFSQLKDAALTTLEIQQCALNHGMTLKDCSAYNIQFYHGKPVFIDTLSFETYEQGTPWIGYRQFCQHFLAPLALMCHTDVRLSTLFRSYIDGIPLDLASRILPRKTRYSMSLLMHIHLHAKSQAKFSDKPIEGEKFAHKVSRNSLLGLLDSLKGAIQKQTWRAAGTEWADYYNDDSYVPQALQHKQELITGYLREASPKTVWDLGANNGFHSRIASSMGAFTVAFDVDPACVEMNYLNARKSGETNILPLIIDLTNPSPGIGWANKERVPVAERGCADVAMALALIHHLAISNNVPLGRIAEYFRSICNSLIIEFVPKSDHKVQRLLATREDIFDGYTQECFESEFSRYFKIEHRDRIADSERTLYFLVGS